jgi:hypothetical protein
MKSNIDNLKKNFLFQASLGSKELFHSNMLAWILEQKNSKSEYEPFRIFLNKVLQIETGIVIETHTPTIERESQNIDLTLKWKQNDDWNAVFIENKMKSIPTIEQLNEYDRKIEKFKGKTKLSTPSNQKLVVVRKLAGKFLLTPYRSHLIQNAANIGWKNITYSDQIIPFLIDIQSISFENSDVNFIVDKYIHFLINQNDIIGKLGLNLNNSEFAALTYNFYDNFYKSKLTDLRLHDFVYKLIHSKIEQILRLQFTELKIDTNRISSNFTNTTGMTSVDVEIKSKSGFFIGVQLQGNQFRYYLATNDKKKVNINEKLSVELFNRKIWFHDLENKSPLIGNGKRKDYFLDLGFNSSDPVSNTTFCEYGKGGFIYLYKKLDSRDEAITIQSLVSLYVRSFQHYFMKRDEIISIINELTANN